MTIKEWLRTTQQAFKVAAISTPQLDSEVLLCHALGVDRSWIHAHDDFLLSFKQLILLNSYKQRRISHEPIAYILCKKDFYGRDFLVDNSVLVPRPESEAIIELFLTLPSNSMLKVADIGCGSGVLGISAALERPEIDITLIDIYPEALLIAQKNATYYGLETHFVQSDLLSSIENHYDVLLCNLPYVPVDYPVNLDTSHEPRIALFSGEDGLDHYYRLFEELQHKKHRPIIITESLVEQHEKLSRLAASHNYSLGSLLGLAQLFVPLL